MENGERLYADNNSLVATWQYSLPLVLATPFFMGIWLREHFDCIVHVRPEFTIYTENCARLENSMNFSSVTCDK